MLPKFRNWFNWVGGYSLMALIALLIVVIGTWVFVELADEVAEGGTHTFDNRIMQYVGRHRGPPWLEEVGRDLTALGGVAVLSLMTLGVAGFLFVTRKFHAMWLVLFATFGGLFLSTALKWIIDRDRPAVFEHRSHVYTQSFPSGHSMLSAVVYLTLGSMLTRLVPGYRAKLYLLSVALFLTFLVGINAVARLGRRAAVGLDRARALTSRAHPILRVGHELVLIAHAAVPSSPSPSSS